MKQIILLSLFINQLLANPPSWYVNQNILSKSYEIIGYGEGSTIKEAKQIIGDENCIDLIDPVMGGEDFSEYLNKNIDSLKGKSLTQIFMDFISQAEKEKKDLLNLIKQKL